RLGLDLARAQALAQPVRDRRPEIGLDQRVLELGERRGIDALPAEHAIDAADQAVGRTLQPRLEALEPAHAATPCRAAAWPRAARGARLGPGSAGGPSRTLRKCGAWPLMPSRSTSTPAIVPASRCASRARAAAPAARRRAARSLIAARGTCGMRAAGV